MLMPPFYRFLWDTMKMLHFAAVAVLAGLSEAWVPSITRVGFHTRPSLSRLYSNPLSENLLGIALGDEFDVSIPADFDITDAKKAWPKRRRSASPLLVHVSLSEEAAVLGEGGGGVTTLLRVGKGELENLQLVAGSKLRAYVAEVKPGGAPGASSSPSSNDDDDEEASGATPSTPPPALQEEDQTSAQAATLILSCSRSYARGRGTAPNAKPAASTASAENSGSSSSSTSRGRGPAPEGALLLSSLSPGDALEHCKVVKVLPSGALFASCGVVRPGKGGAWTHVDGFVFPGDLGDRAVAPGADALAFERTFGAGTLAAATKRAKANRQRAVSDAKAEARLLAVEEALKLAKENGELSSDDEDDDDLEELEDLPMPPPPSASSSLSSRNDDYDVMAQLLNTNLRDADSALGVLNGPWRSVIDLWPGFDSTGLKGARNLQRLQSTYRGGSVEYFDHVVSNMPKEDVVIDEESGDAWLSFGDLLAALEEDFPGVRVTLKAVTGVMRRRAPLKGTVPQAPPAKPPRQVTFGGFILDNEDANAEGNDDGDEEDGTDVVMTNDDGEEISDGPMLLFEEASLLPGGSSGSAGSSSGSGRVASGSLAKRQREATLLSPRPQARRMLQRFAALVQASGAADLAAASGARAKAEALADDAAALAPAVLARGAMLPGARVKSCSKQSGKLVLALDSSDGSSGSSSSSGAKSASPSGSNKNSKKAGGRKVKVVEVGQAVKGTVTKSGTVHLGPSLEADLWLDSEGDAPKEGSVVDVVVCSASAAAAGQQTVRVALAGSDNAVAALEQAGSSGTVGGAASDAHAEFDALLAASDVSARAKYEGGDEDDEEDDNDEDEDDEDDDNAPMTVDDL